MGFFWDWLNVHTFNHRHRADRRVKWLVAEWVGRGMGGRCDGWVCGMGGLQKLITDLDMKNGYKGGA